MIKFGLASQFPLVSSDVLNPNNGKPSHQSPDLEWKPNCLVTCTKDTEGVDTFLYFPVSVSVNNSFVRIIKGPTILTDGILMLTAKRCIRVTRDQITRGKARGDILDFDMIAASVMERIPRVVVEEIPSWVAELGDRSREYTLHPETFWRAA